MEQDLHSLYNIEFEYYTTGSGEKRYKTIFLNIKKIFLNKNGFNLDFMNGSFICFGHGWGYKYSILTDIPKIESTNNVKDIEDFDIEEFIDFSCFGYPLEENANTHF